MTDQAPEGESRYFVFDDGDELVDRGTFLAREGGVELASEHFTLVRRRRRGLFRRKGGGLSVTSVIRTRDQGFVMDARVDYNRRIDPVLAESQIRARFGNEWRDWTAGFKFKPPQARLMISTKTNPIDMNIACEKGCMIDIDPSIVPAAVLIQKFDMKKRGTQTFRWIAYAAQDAHFGINRRDVEARYVERIKAKDAEGARLKLHYLVVDERAPSRGAKTAGVHRRLHLWADDRKRLRKAVAVLPDGSYTFIRSDDGAVSGTVEPFPVELNPNAPWIES